MSRGEAFEPRPAGEGRRINGDRSPEELQQDIERHRHNLDRTLSALESKLSPGELLDEGLSYLTTGPSEFVSNLSHSARQNPVPMALTAVGLTWLIFGQRKPQQSQPERNEQHEQASPKDTAATVPPEDDLTDLYAFHLTQEYPFEEDEIDCIVFDDFGPEAYATYEAKNRRGQSSLREKAARVRDKVGATTDQARDKAGQWTEQARENASEMREQTRARMDQVRQRMAQGSAEVRDRIEHARDVAWRRARRARMATARGARETARRTGEFVERNPMTLVAAGLAVGAALAAALPVSRREDRMLGGTGETLRSKGREKVREEADRVRHAAAAARDAGMETAREEGLTGEGMRQHGRVIRDKAEKVAEAARSESERQGLTGEAVGDELHRVREKVEDVASAARDAAREEESKDR